MNYIDLGLPSGTKWAECNVGAHTPEEYGDYYTFDNAKKLDVTLPTKEQIKELVNSCTSVWTTLGGKNGWLCKGPNGNTVFLPAAGGFDKKYYGTGGAGFYWSNTLREDCRFEAYVLCVSLGYSELDRYGLDMKLPVRAVATMTINFKL